MVAITGTSLHNDTFDGLIALCRPDAFVLLLGPTTPLSPLLFDYGVDLVAGTRVVDPAAALTTAGQGANLSPDARCAAGDDGQEHVTSIGNETSRTPGGASSVVVEAKVRKALEGVMDPELHKSLIELGMVRQVRIERTGGHHPGADHAGLPAEGDRSWAM